MFDIIWFDRLPSTQTYIRELTPKNLTVVAAKTQDGGYGRGGKPYFCPRGGLYASIFMQNDEFPLKNMPAGLPLTSRAALAVRRLMLRRGVDLRIKWVNDLYLGEKKACGILTQAVPGGVVLGIGLNLKPCKIPLETAAFCGAFSPEELLPLLCSEIFQVISEENLLKEYKNASAVLGREVSYEEDGRRLRGFAEDVLPSGELLLRGGKILRSGEVHLRVVPGE